MTGFRVAPTKVDKNEKEENCKLYYEKVMPTTSSKGRLVKLQWYSFPVELITLFE